MAAAAEEEEAPLNQSFQAPDAFEVILHLDDAFYDTAPEQFDSFEAALRGLDFAPEQHSAGPIKLNGLLEKMEKVDLQRDAIATLLSREVSKSKTGLLDGMQKVVDLDLELTRTLLFVRNLRRRLRLCKTNSIDSHLLISTLHSQISDTIELQELCKELEFARNARLECEFEASVCLSQQVERTLASLSKLQDVEQESELVAVRAVRDGLRRNVALFDSANRNQIKSALLPSPNGNKSNSFQDSMLVFKLLKRSDKEVSQCLEEIWTSVVESILLSSDLERSTIQDGAHTTPEMEDVFAQLAWACRALDQELAQDMDLFRQTALQIVSTAIERYLASPEIRSLPLLPFAKTLQAASNFVQRELAVTFFQAANGSSSNNSTAAIKSKLESTLRLRSRIYAQTFQAEGFQLMRALLWRETWTNVFERGSGEDLVHAIFQRLNLEENDAKATATEEWVLTATLASGIPRQVQRTMDLMTSLPQSASGEAFLGLQIVFDLYLFAISSVFLPNILAKLITFDSKHATTTATAGGGNASMLAYLFLVKECLLEWISSEEDELCEHQYALVPGELSLPCLTAGDSLYFLRRLLASLERPMSALLPPIERQSLASKMFVDLPFVLHAVQDQCRESAVEAWLRPYIYFPADMVQQAYKDDSPADFVCFHPVLAAMKLRIQDLLNMDQVRSKEDVWDEAVRYFLDRFLDALASLTHCSVMSRGQMALHLASFWDAFQAFPIPPSATALRAKARVDDFIKAYYFDQMADLSAWILKNKTVFDTFHFAAVFETGMVQQQQNAGGTTTSSKRELKQEFDRLIASF